VLSALGMGGGGILLIYLTVYAGVDQLTAQGVNLVFFIPVALVALNIHAKNKLIRWKIVWPCVLLGLLGVWGGAQLAMYIGSQTLSRLFGGFLLIIGVREFFVKPEKKGQE
jgi:uncharacterized membrane protein YfcA